MKNKTTDKKGPICRERLLQAVESTYDQASFLIGTAVEREDNFLNGLRRHRGEFISKQHLMEIASKSHFTQFPSMPEFESYLVLSERQYVLRDSINEAQVFPQTPNVDGFIHAIGLKRPWYDVYYQIDAANRTITFALGNSRKTLLLQEHTGWAWKLTRSALLCNTAEQLAQVFQDDFWNPIAVLLGRKALRIADVI